MPLISERIAHFLGGVSQRADVQRDPSQGSGAINALSHPTFGLMKRPPTRHGAVLSYIPSDWPGAYVYPIQTSFNERYRAIITDGEMKIFNSLSGAEVPITFEDGKGYLDTTGAAPNAAFRCVQIGDRVVVINRNTQVQQATVLSPAQSPDALVVVVEATYNTEYAITLNTHSVSFSTSDARTAGDRSLRTSEIAAELKVLIDSSPVFSGTFTVVQYGSTLHIAKQVSGTFDIEVSDGLADHGLLLIHPSVDRAEQLPKGAPDGYVAKVAGEKSKTSDDTWYEYAVTDSIWKETVEPGTLIDLLASSMPHELLLNNSEVANVQHDGEPQAPDGTTGGAGGQLHFPTILATEDGSPAPQAGGANNQSRIALFTDADPLFVNLAQAGASGGDVTIKFRYDIQAGQLVTGNTVSVSIWASDSPSGGTYTQKGTADVYSASDGTKTGRTIEATFDASTNFDVKLQLVHSIDPTVNLRYGIVWLWLPSSSQAPYCEYRIDDKALLTFPTTGKYPGGVQMSVFLEGTHTLNYTPTNDETGSEVATGLAAIINAHASYNATATGTTITIGDTATPTTPPTVVWSTAFDSDTMYHGPSLALTPGSIVGSTLNNLTDGSTGTITANTATTITVDDLTGGFDNSFDEFDSISVEALAESFVFRQVDWKSRASGSLETNGFPSFLNKRITAVFFHRGRLGLCAGSSFAMSEAGEYQNWFRTSVTSLLDSDVIDVDAETQQTGTFFAGVSVGDQQLLFTDAGQYEITSGPLLTPATVGIRQVTSYLSAPQCDPAPLGRQVAFAFDNYGHVQAQLYGLLPEATRTFSADDLTRDVPRFLKGNVRQMVGFTGINLLVVLTNTEGGVGLPGLTSDPYLDPTAQVIPPQPPPAPPALPPVGGDDVGLAGQAEQELFVEVETAVDVSVINAEAKADTDVLGSITDAWTQATEGPLPDTVKATQVEAASMTEVEGIEDTELFSDEIKSDSDSITESESWVQVIDGYTSAVILQTANVNSNLQWCSVCQPPKFLNTRTTAQFIQSGAQSVRERIYLGSQNGTLKRTTTYNVAPDNANWIFGSFFTGSEESEGVFTYWIELTPFLGPNATGLEGTSVWITATLLNIA